jgi:hypothetical protein
LKIPNGQPEALNERLTANIMANKKKDKKTDNGQRDCAMHIPLSFPFTELMTGLLA